MRFVILILDAILIILSIIQGIDIGIYFKKNKDKKVEDIKEELDKKLKVMQILIILLTIFGVLLIINNLIRNI